MDVLLWLLVGAFVVWEFYAHFIAKNRSAHTLSNRIWWLEKKYPKTRVVVLLACVLLAVHLTVRWV